jgi:two-component system C4-dicarboxylate transport response regulator DctD
MGIPGTGLGLAIVKEIVELYDGRILLSSQKDVGSTFTVLLPIVLEEEKGAPRVVVVDDDPAVSDIVAQYLRLLGCRVESVADGAAGFAKVSDDPPDLMILDIGLPGMDGITVLSLLSAMPSTKNMPILVVTGRSDIDEAHVKRLGAAALLQKPFFRPAFSEQVAKLLALKA